MIRLLLVFLLLIYLIYISTSIYKFIRHRKTEKIFLRFMTSCMILFTFSMVYYGGFFSTGSTGERYDVLSPRGESKVFLSNISSGTQHENDSINNKDMEIKISAYFDNTSPGRGATINLIVKGPTKGKVTAICQYKGHGTPYIMDIGEDGLAVIPVVVESDAEPGVMVMVDISVNYQGKLYKTNSFFVPQ